MLYTLIFLLLVLVCPLVTGVVEVRCIEREREALLSFKKDLIDESGFLSSWGITDECCKWDGVVCSNTTAHVIRLDLGTGGFVGVLGGKLSSSMLELHQLYYLDLSYNDFGGDPIPAFMGSMKQLQHLHLKHSNFAGIVPPQLGNLTKLQTLDLSLNYLRYENLSWLSTLSSLSFLSLGDNDLGGNLLPEFICSMKQLQHLHLGSCNLSGIIPPQLGNLTNLLTLDLSYNYFLSSDNLDWLSNLSLLSLLDLSQLDLSHTNWLQNMLSLHSLENLYLASCNISDVRSSESLFVNSSSTSLSILDLFDNHLTSSTLDRLSNFSTSLVRFDLSQNAFVGMIPHVFEKLNLLEHLDLSMNMLRGGIPNSLGNLTHMRVLVLYDNEFDELFGNATGILPSLKILDLDSNQLRGAVPDLGAFSALTELYLGANKFTGSVPLSLGQLSKLEVLDLSSNNLVGTVSESHLNSFDNLKVLGFASNSLKVGIAPDWTPPFQLKVLLLAGCHVGPSIPKWIESQRNLTVLDLSDAGIINEVPMWLWNFSLSMPCIGLSDNQITGTLPDLSSTPIVVLDVSFNKISGPIPLFGPYTEAVELSNNMLFGSISSLCKIVHHYLYHLDLSNNQLSGELPDCWDKMPYINYLSLANNRFCGEIPHSLCSSLRLTELQLHENNLSGQLPSTLRFCQNLQMIDVGRNQLEGYVPSWIGEITELFLLNLRSNRFYGSIPPEICNLTRIRILDMSTNNLSGKIPNCFNRFISLSDKFSTRYIFGVRYIFHLNTEIPNPNFQKDYNGISSFQWKGQELEYRRQNLVLLTLVDLSSNRLSGNIPDSFSSMKGLISLNLSRNNLTGNIIHGVGQMKMLECLDLSDNQLAGKIPKSLGDLSFLSFLNLSNNNLSGEIPSSTQLQSFNISSYAGNKGLCGRPMALCPGDKLMPPTTTHGENGDGFWRLSFMQGFIISMVFGLIVGFWGVIGCLLLKKSWRYAYFRLLDGIGDSLCVRISAYLSK